MCRIKETFATSGPRLRARLFASFEYEDDLLNAADRYEQAYAKGVSMGSELPVTAQRAPAFLAWAARDPNSAPLQRLQIVKGWTTVDGEHHERVWTSPIWLVPAACGSSNIRSSMSSGRRKQQHWNR